MAGYRTAGEKERWMYLGCEKVKIKKEFRMNKFLQRKTVDFQKKRSLTHRQLTVCSRYKRVLEFRGTDHFNVLPDGWIEITHASGLPIYLVPLYYTKNDQFANFIA